MISSNFVSLFLILCSINIGTASEKHPVYIYLYDHTEDHFNHELSEERFLRVFPMIEQLQKDYPQYYPSFSVQLYGADSWTLSERNPETGVVDFIRKMRDKGVIELGYHGVHEPTYALRQNFELFGPFALFELLELSELFGPFELF